jgi:hypothetical protein
MAKKAKKAKLQKKVAPKEGGKFPLNPQPKKGGKKK